MAKRLTKTCSRARLWRVLRVSQLFTTTELALCAGAELATARAFVSNLGRAGLVERHESGWRLVKDTGPKAPETRRGGIFDTNTGDFYPYVKRRGAKAATESAMSSRTASKGTERSKATKATKAASKPPSGWRPGLPGCLPGEGL